MRGASHSRRGVNRDTSSAWLAQHEPQIRRVSQPRLLLQPTRVSRHNSSLSSHGFLASFCVLFTATKNDPAAHATRSFSFIYQRSVGSANSSSASYSATIAIPLEQPRRSAPAATIASASALLWMPPAALTLQVSPTVCFIRATS